MAIVKNRFDLLLLNHLVEKTGGCERSYNPLRTTHVSILLGLVL